LESPAAFPVTLPFFFVGLWLVVTTILYLVSGWYWLQKRYPDQEESTILKIGSQSGMMGLGVSMRGILVLSACRSGLRVGIWRVFGPFCRPFFVPWSDISVRTTQLMFRPMARLGFGHPEVGVLSIDRRTWERLTRSASERAVAPIAAQTLPPLSEGRLARAFVLEWLATTSLFAAFFYFAPYLMRTSGPHVPLLICVAFPASFVGIVQVARYVRQRLGR